MIGVLKSSRGLGWLGFLMPFLALVPVGIVAHKFGFLIDGNTNHVFFPAFLLGGALTWALGKYLNRNCVTVEKAGADADHGTMNVSMENMGLVWIGLSLIFPILSMFGYHLIAR